MYDYDHDHEKELESYLEFDPDLIPEEIDDYLTNFDPTQVEIDTQLKNLDK